MCLRCHMCEYNGLRSCQLLNRTYISPDGIISQIFSLIRNTRFELAWIIRIWHEGNHISLYNSMIFSNVQMSYQNCNSTQVTSDRWIPRTKIQFRGNFFHLMMSSCFSFHSTTMQTSEAQYQCLLCQHTLSTLYLLNFSTDINMHLQFLPFLHIDMTQVI